MIIQCTNCLAKFKFNEEKLKDGGSKKVRCSRCQQVFTVVAPDAPAQNPKNFEFTKAKATASRTPTGQMDALNGNKKTKPNFATLDMPVKKTSKENLKPQGKAFSTRSSDELSQAFGSLSGGTGKSGNNKSLKLKTSDFTPAAKPSQPKIDPSSVNTNGRSIDKANGVLQERPNGSDQQNINHEIYKTDKKKAEKPEYTKELMLIKEISFSGNGVDTNQFLPIEDTRVGNDPKQLKKLKLEFAPQELIGSQVEDYPGWSPMKKFMISSVRFILILMIIATVLIGGMMLYKGENFNIYHLGVEDMPLNPMNLNSSE